MKTSPSDITITRANINAEQTRRIKEGKLPYSSAEEVVADFIALPEPRHLGRAIKLGFPSKPR